MEDSVEVNNVVPFRSINSKLLVVQMELKAEKGSLNDFGKYSYRNVEDILSEVKPLLAKNGLIMTMSDRLIPMGDDVYIESRIVIEDASGNDVSSMDGYPNNVVTTSFAREPKDQRGMSPCQMTGTASSYARKYALGAMFLISGEACPDFISDIENQSEDKDKKIKLSPKSPSKGKGKSKVLGKGLIKVIKDLGVLADIPLDKIKGRKTIIPCKQYSGKPISHLSDQQIDYLIKNQDVIFPNHPNFLNALSGDKSIDQQVADDKPYAEGDQ